MKQEELNTLFDQQAAGYDKQWARMSPIRDSLYFLLETLFGGLPANARILNVGTGTGAELAHLAKTFPGFRFTAVDPSAAMVEVSRARAGKDGFASRCEFHVGYVDSLPAQELFDGATCFLVSQFILHQQQRREFFRSIAMRLRPGGLLASSDLACDTSTNDYAVLLPAWINTMAAAGVRPEVLESTRAAYAKDVAILPSSLVSSIIVGGGFESSVQFFQAGLMHAWISKRGVPA
jgi:tRNA (cmo5U34)-methyltransferase